MKSSPVTLSEDLVHTKELPTYRSGAAARLAGIPVETLRVWERRYQVAGPQRSPHGQRRYSELEIRRLSLIKQLVDLGNPISAVAELPSDQLSNLLDSTHSLRVNSSQSAAIVPFPLRIAIVGESIGRRLAGIDWHTQSIDVVKNCVSVPHAAEALRNIAIDVLVLEVLELIEPPCDLIESLKLASRAEGIVILYRFSPMGTVRSLREAGYVVAHTPADPLEIEALCRVSFTGVPRDRSSVHSPAFPLDSPPPHFDEKALTAISRSSNILNCECPRHLVDILRTLGSFERYSAQCERGNPADAELHDQLYRITGQARHLMESALQMVVDAESSTKPAL
ncbi:MerR family transcriptional regulator [Undibacterium terreum]|uniref:MerR family transcriptional regulator n=1 Tax=Undibacterium terreum TaxID=1224302 RepID=UPI001668874B|nr:MerR family transcriptional regulator [Undibacterium terreum]